jgi:hypothetical protein
MFRSIPLLLSVLVLLVASVGCAVPNAPPATGDPDVFGTFIAQTVAVALTQSAVPSMAPVIMASDTPVFTFTPEFPTFTPTETPTPMPIFTSTPQVPQISVSVATNCRVGPGRVYDRVGALLVGQVAEVVGRNSTANYWYIRTANGGFCWLWGEYATLAGDTSVLPVYTPPPSPTPAPNFELDYGGKDSCSGWWVEIDLINTGGITFKSYSLSLRDTNTDVVLSMYADGFTDKNGCLDSTTRDNLHPGTERTISSPAFNYDPTGHRLRATVTLCSNPGQNGTCVTRVMEFKP